MKEKLLLLILLFPLFIFGEGGKNLTPSSGGIATGNNQFVGYLQNGDANNSLSFLAHPLEPGFNTSHRLLIRIKPGEVVYYGIQRIDASGTLANNDTVIINLRRIDNGVIVKSDTFTSSAVPSGLLNPRSGVIASYAAMTAGPSAVVGASGYNALSYTFPAISASEVDLAVEILDDGPTATIRASSERDWYSLWDFSVYNGTTEKNGRLHAKYWSFNAASASNRLSTSFNFFTAVPNTSGNQYYIKSINLSGMQPFGFFFTANESGTLKNTAGVATDNYQLRRKSRNFYTGVFADGYTQYDNFVNDPDIEFWPTAIIQNPVISPRSICNSTRPNGGAMQIAFSVTSPGVALIMLDLNNVDGYQPSTKDVLIEVAIYNPIDTIITWNGLDGLGNNVASGTAFKTIFRYGSFPVHYPIYDAENNSDGFAIFDNRPQPALTAAIAFWDDSTVIAGSAEIFGITSNGSVHRWGGGGAGIFANNIGDTRLFNTWIYGQLREFKNIYLHSYSCVNLPPVANNYTNSPMPQTNGATILPLLIASDPDGTVANFTIQTIPLATEGVLSYCSNGTQPCTGSTIPVVANTILTPAQMLTLQFDPAPNFAGITSFNFSVTDNSGNTSNVATYKLPVSANPPIANNIVIPSIRNTNGPTLIANLSAADADGTISTYTIGTVPPISEGQLSYCSNGTEPCTGLVEIISSSTVLTPSQMATLKFDPADGFIGNATFTYTALDNSGNISNLANYTIPIAPTSRTVFPPLVDNIVAEPINNSAASTAIPKLQATDLDGTVASFTINTIPPVTEGILYYCPNAPLACNSAELLAVTAGIVLTPSQSASLQFDPSLNFVGVATFTYTATDNTGKVGNTATYSIPVVNQPPTVANITTTVPFNANATVIPFLSGLDADGSLVNFVVNTIPSASEGQLLYCPLAPLVCAIGDLLPITANLSLTPDQAKSIYFDPANNFSGNVNFTYTAIDNNGNTSTTGNYKISIANQPPVAQNINLSSIPNSNGNTAISPLIANDVDGTISNFIIQTIPSSVEGTLFLCTPSCVAVFPGQSLTPSEISNLTFTPNPTFNGIANFTYTAIDNTGDNSNLAFYNIPVIGVGNLPPISNTIIAPAINSNQGSTLIPTLNSSDIDGSISFYTIEFLPPASQGILLLNGLPIFAGQTLTPAEISQLQFDPTSGYTGNAVFEYSATDNNGLKSGNATYTIPVVNQPPVSNSVIANTIPNTNGATNLPPLNSTDVDGSVASYTISSLPSAAQGVLLLNGLPITVGQILTPAEISQLQFDPALGYSGNVLFDYYATDNNNLLSNVATYSFGVTGMPPISQNVVSQTLINVNGPTSIPSLSSSDDDGVINNYIIISLPPANQGVLLLNGTPIVAGQSLTPSEINQLQFDPAANYTGIALFNYAAFDNYNNLSNTATYVIPITSATILPVTILNYNVSLQSNKAFVNWEVTNERNVRNYQVEKSINGVDFSTIESINAIASTTLNKQYQYIDNNPITGVNYYRIKIIDVDAKFSYSVIKTVIVNNNSKISCWPNPFINEVNISIKQDKKAQVAIILYDAKGSIVANKFVMLQQGNNQITIDKLQSLSAGIYTVKIIDASNSKIEVIKLKK